MHQSLCTTHHNYYVRISTKVCAIILLWFNINRGFKNFTTLLIEAVFKQMYIFERNLKFVTIFDGILNVSHQSLKFF